MASYQEQIDRINGRLQIIEYISSLTFFVLPQEITDPLLNHIKSKNLDELFASGERSEEYEKGAKDQLREFISLIEDWRSERTSN